MLLTTALLKKDKIIEIMKNIDKKNKELFMRKKKEIVDVNVGIDMYQNK